MKKAGKKRRQSCRFLGHGDDESPIPWRDFIARPSNSMGIFLGKNRPAVKGKLPFFYRDGFQAWLIRGNQGQYYTV